MKILESQNAVLSNFEVFQHLVDQQSRYKKARRRGPPNLETVVRELLQYLRTKPGPLSQKPITYDSACIAILVERLQPYDLSKGEMVVILNLRPTDIAALNTVVEDMSERYTEEQQEEMVGIIVDVLGQFGPAADRDENEDEDADVTMNDDAGVS